LVGIKTSMFEYRTCMLDQSVIIRVG